MPTPYDPNDPLQAAFLATVQAGENAPGNPFLGYGGTDLSNAPYDAYGFPQWSGKQGPAGISHAAGLFQDQPATWARIAQATGANFQNPADQVAGNWWLAQSDYAAKSGGADLETALASNPASVGTTLTSTWTSLGSNFLSRFNQALSGSAQPAASGTPGLTGTGTTSGTGTTAGSANPATGLPAGAANPCTGGTLGLGGFFTWGCWQGIIADLAFVFLGVVVFVIAVASGLFGSSPQATGRRALRAVA